MPFSGQEVSEKGFPQGWTTDADSSTAQRIFRVTQLLEAMVTRDWSWDRFNSLGLRYSFHGGLIDNGLDGWVLIADGSVTLANDATNFIERSDAGVISVNQSGFTYLGFIPMAQIDTRSESFLPTTYTDRRPSLGVAPSGVSGGTTTFPQIIGLILDSQVPLSAVAQWESFLSIAFIQLTGVATKAQLPSTVAYEDETNTFDLLQTFSAGISIADGQSISWSDVSLSRGAADRLDLATGDDFRIVSGELQFGADTNLFRASANVLQTDDDFVVGGTLAVTGTSTAIATLTNTGNFAADLILDADRTSENNPVGRLIGRWNGNVIAQIQFAAGPDTVNKDDGKMFLRTAAPGGTITTAVTIDENQDVTLAGNLAVTGVLTFGADTNLFRASANVLQTDDDFVCDSFSALGSLFGALGATPVAQTAAYTPTNVTPDRSFDANSTTIDELADVIGTIIADQQSFGFFG